MEHGQRVRLPYLICPHCGEVIYCLPDFEFYIRIIPSFGVTRQPVLRIEKNIPYTRIMQDENLKEHRPLLHDFILRVAQKKPLFCTAITTTITQRVYKEMIERNVVKEDEISNSYVPKPVLNK